jgi:Flp pilus assembly protein TadG
MTTSPPKHFQAPQPQRRSGRLAVIRAQAAEQHGTALVEFALVLPLLLAILFGIAQFGLAINSMNDETHLANEVARYATVNENPASTGTLQEWAKRQVDSNALGGQKVCIIFPSGAEIGKPVEVTVKGTINFFPILKLKPLERAIEGKAVMRLEATPTANVTSGCSP